MTPMKIQLALDFTQLGSAIDAARKAAVWVDMIEAGTPLIKACGMQSVSRLKEAFPGKKIVADMKTADVGFLEAGMAASAGADFMTVMGAAPNACIEESLRGCRKYGIELLADTIGVGDVFKRARELKSLGVTNLILHRGIDEAGGCGALLSCVSRIKRETAMNIWVAGGMNEETALMAKDSGVDVIIVGRHITASGNPSAAAKALSEKVRG